MSQEIALLEKGLQASPDNWQVRRSLASRYVQAGQAENAARIMLEAPLIPPGEKDQIFAAQLMAETDPAAAHRLLDTFLEDSPASGQGHLLKGRLHRAAGEHDKAESHFNVAAVFDPSIDIAQELAAAPEESVAVVAVEEEDGGAAEAASPPAAEKPAAAPEAKAAPVELPPAPPVAGASSAVAAAVALSPRALAPPEAAGSAPSIPLAPLPTGSPALAAPAPEDGEPSGESDGESDGEDGVEVILGEDGLPLHEGERAFIVAEGEMVHAAEKESDAKAKLSALTVAIAVHVAIAFLLGLYVIAMPRPAPPQITASVVQSDDSSIENQTVTRVQKRAAATATVQQVVSVEAFSAVSIPDLPDMTSSLTMANMGDGDTGIGMSMSGFGDVSNMGAIPPAMRSRCSMSQRMQRLRESGGEDRAEKAVRNGLEWLSQQQNENGSFGKEYPAAMTGLVLLAYLGHCETPESPRFGDSVVNATLYLMEVAKKNDGLMTNGKKGHHESYEHGIAVYALCELYTMTNESGRAIPGLENVLRRSVAHIINGQTRGGGWAYGYAQNPAGDDMSLAGWQMQALKAAHNTGRRFAGIEKAMDKAMDYTKKVQDAKGAFKYRPANPEGKPTLTGAALLGMQIWDQMDTPEYKKGISYLAQAYANPTPGGNFYAPYYNTQAFFIHGGKEWEDYNGKFQGKLLDAQNPDGSWTREGAGGQGGADSQIMNTAWGCLMLEVYYRYLPTTDKVDGLKAR